MAVSLILRLWRVWKWLVHLFTGKCEICRLCEWKAPLEERTWRIDQSLKNSQSAALRGVAGDGGTEVDEAVEIIAREKKIKLRANQGFSHRLRPCLVRIVGVRVLWREAESLRVQSYSQDNDDHEKMLLELWGHLMPDTPLESRITKQWQEIGFQGNNPATDFRGMGVLTLHCLLFFATTYKDRARSILTHSHHPQYHYPFAVVGIHLANLLHSWLESGTLNRYFYTTGTEWPLQLDDLMEIYCYLFYQFDQFWLEQRPENVMAFPRVKDEFVSNMEEKLTRETITILMRLQ